MTKEIIAINTTADGCAFTVCARYGAACARNLLGGGHNYPMSAVEEIICEDSGELQPDICDRRESD